MYSTSVEEIARQLAYLVRREIDYRFVKARDALFFITYRCTSNCRTCSMWQRKKAGDELSLAEWQRVAEECQKLGVQYIELFGGDALLRADVLIPLVAHIKKLGVMVDLVTNCNLMDQATAEGLVEAGLDDLWMSIDGVGADHDEVRGKQGSYGKVERCIEAVKRARGEKKRPLLHCNTTISKFNVDAFDRVLPFAEEMGLDFMHLEYAGEFRPEMVNHTSINGVRPNPYYIFQGDSVLVDQAQATLLKEKVRRLKEDARGMKIKLATENVDCLSVGDLVNGECGNTKCYVARFKVTVDPYGNVLPCPFFGDYHLGNIRNEDLSQILRNKKHLSFTRGLAKIWPTFCRHCILGVQRNRTFWQLVRERTHSFMRSP